MSPSRVTEAIALRTSSARRGPSASDSGVAAMRTITSSESTSSREMCGSWRTGVVTPFSSRSCTSDGLTSGRSRARRSTAAGSRSGTTAEVRTTLFGTMIESSPRESVT